MKSSIYSAMAVGSIVMGLLTGFWLWLIPMAGLPVALIGLTLGLLAMKTTRVALAGAIFSLIALTLSLLNLGIEMLMGPGIF